MNISSKSVVLFACLSMCLATAGCGHGHDDGHDHDHGNENEVITAVILTFTPSAGGTPIVATVNDPDGDGGAPPTVDPINLPAGTYDLTVGFENRLESPPANIGAEISDEAEEHQIFFTGTAVNGPASSQASAPLTHAYADADSQGLPIGLKNTISATAGTGTLTVTLRHLPPVNDTAVKTSGLAQAVRMGGFAAIAGSSDAQVNFPVAVQ